MRSSAALLVGFALVVGGCGGGEPPGLTLDQLSATEVEELLSSPMGGLGFDGFVPHVLEEVPPGLLPGIGGVDLPRIAPDCQQGILGGRWRALGRDVGIFFGLWSQPDLPAGRFVGGIYGHGKLFGMVVGADGEPRTLLSGRYDGASFSGELIEPGERRVGRVSGRFSSGRFGGSWQRCVDAPPPACLPGRIARSMCLPDIELLDLAEAQCAARGMILTSHTFSATCGGGDDGGYPYPWFADSGTWHADAWMETDGGYAAGGSWGSAVGGSGGYADGGSGGYADGGSGGYADGGSWGYADGGSGGYADGGYADAGRWQGVWGSDGGPVGPMPRYRPSEPPYPYLSGHHEIGFTCCAQDPAPPPPPPEPCVAHEVRMEGCLPEAQLRSQADQICQTTDSFLQQFVPVDFCADPWTGARPAGDPLPGGFSGADFLCCQQSPPACVEELVGTEAWVTRCDQDACRVGGYDCAP